MLEFKVNEYITLRLENKNTRIYVNDELFRQCRFLLLNIPVDEVSSFDEVDSIDEAAEKLDGNIEDHFAPVPPETEFWGHSSNIQLWVEHSYDTRLLHRTIAFPLLKKLTEAGDPIAKRVFKEEIAKRLESKNPSVVGFLILEGFLKYLDEGYLEEIGFPTLDRLSHRDRLIRVIKMVEAAPNFKLRNLFDLYCAPLLQEIERDGRFVWGFEGDEILRTLYERLFFLLLKRGDFYIYDKLWESGYLGLVSDKEKIYIMADTSSNLFEYILFKLENPYPYIDKLSGYKDDIISLNKQIVKFLLKNDFETTEKIIKMNLLRCVPSESLASIFQDSALSTFDIFMKVYKEYRYLCLDELESFYEYISYFREIGKYLSTSLKNKIKHVLEKQDLEEFTLVLELRWLEYLDNTELKKLLNDPNINFVSNLRKIFREMYSEYRSGAYIGYIEYREHIYFMDILSQIILFLFKVYQIDEGEHIHKFYKVFSPELKNDFLNNLASLLELSQEEVKKEYGYKIFKFIADPEKRATIKWVKLNGERFCVNNGNLSITRRDFSDVSEIKGLKKFTFLKKLTLSGEVREKWDDSGLLEINGLEKFKDLRELNLEYNRISEIKGLNALKNLRVLNLRGNKISEIKGLEELVNLEELSLDRNQIKEIKGLTALTELKKLELSYNKISEIRGVDNLKKLEGLLLKNNRIKEIKGIKNLVNLKYLNLQGNFLGKGNCMYLEENLKKLVRNL